MSTKGQRPIVVVLGGPNGAGKSTIARAVIAEIVQIREFVNADTIATGLSGFDPDAAAFAAGRIMLARLRELASARQSFAFESTLASRTFAPWLSGLRSVGYEVHVVFVWLRSAELAIKRVKKRVSKGGHDVPAEVVRRRYARSMANFRELYAPIATTWAVYNNSDNLGALVATGGAGVPPTILNRRVFSMIWSDFDGQRQEKNIQESD